MDASKNNRNNIWHSHPEIELVYVNGGVGKRQIVSNLSYYTNGTLILMGSNLPHCGFTDKPTAIRSQTVIQMKTDFLGNDFFDIPEMKKIQTIFEIAKAGVVFFGETKQQLEAKMEALDHQSNFEYLLSISTFSY